MRTRVGASLAGTKGDTPSRIGHRAAILGRVLAFGLPVAAVLTGLGGVLAGLGEPTLSGLSLEPPGGHVVWVDPASLAWRAGIRPGQLVVELADSSEVAGWAVVTMDDIGPHALTSSAVAATLRFGLVPAALGAVLGMLGLVSGRHRRRAELLGALALAIGAVPFAAAHLEPWAWATGAAALLASAIWLARWAGHRRVGILLVGISAGLAAVEAITPALGSVQADVVPDVRFTVAACLVLATFAIGSGVTTRGIARRTDQLRMADVAAAMVIIGLAAAVAVLAAPPWWALVGGFVAAGLLYARARVSVRGLIDRALFAEDRERAAIESAESERARLSRELHDDPLQALTGVIRSLEDRPDTERERDTLRAVAGQLRNIASALHPPVLDDLGLVPAVQSLFAEQGPIPIRLELANEAGYRPTERPPFEVELASYRIIAEAATNAIRHSGCGEIVVRGHVTREAVAIDVVDDGRGFDADDLERALRGGHLGVASMRRRAEAIDASLSHAQGADRGTVVSLRWSE